METVFILKDDKVSSDRFDKIIGELGLFERLKKATVICIKPNLAASTRYDASSGIFVRTSQLESIVQSIRKINKKAEIRILESDSTGHGYAYLKFEKQGYQRLVELYPPLRLIDLSRDRLRTVRVEGLYFDTVELAESIFNTDFFISIAKMKTHNMTVVTGSLKNLFGCLPESNKTMFHPQINKIIADLSAVIHIDLSILDGNPGMQGNGPVRGDPLYMERILIGNHPVSTDAVMARIMGFNPERICHLRLAASKTGGTLDLSRINIRGLSLDEACIPVKYIGLLQRFIVYAGLKIQRSGQGLYHLGHMVHFQPNMKSLIRVLVRFILLSLFKHSTLRKIKRKLKS